MFFLSNELVLPEVVLIWHLKRYQSDITQNCNKNAKNGEFK